MFSLKLFYLQAFFLRYVAAVIATIASPSKHTYVAASLSSPLFGAAFLLQKNPLFDALI